MQNKGFVKVFAVLLTLVFNSLYIFVPILQLFNGFLNLY